MENTGDAATPPAFGRGPFGDDASVVAASLRDPDAFAVLYDRHARVIHRYLVRRVGPADADDLLAETFIAALRARDRYDLGRPDARPWLFGIATNLSNRLFRRRSRASAANERLISHLARPDSPLDLTDRHLDAEAAWPELAAALDAIPEGHRDALLLWAWEDLSYEEIGVALDIPIGTVRSRIHRARQQLRELVPELRASVLGDGQ